jgi:hypothetical protein
MPAPTGTFEIAQIIGGQSGVIGPAIEFPPERLNSILRQDDR